MDGCSISQVAERTGSSPSARRFDEPSGLIGSHCRRLPELRRRRPRAAFVHRWGQAVRPVARRDHLDV